MEWGTQSTPTHRRRPLYSTRDTTNMAGVGILGQPGRLRPSGRATAGCALTITSPVRYNPGALAVAGPGAVCCVPCRRPGDPGSCTGGQRAMCRRETMRPARWPVTVLCALVFLLYGASLVAPPLSLAHPLGNFSISHYAGLRLTREGIELHYVLDMAEVPTFVEIQETGLVPQVDHPSLRGYLDRRTVALQAGLLLEVNGQRLPLQGVSSEVVFPPGAGDLPTLRLGIVYRARLEAPCIDAPCHLHYRDNNFPGRLGWQEVIAVAAPGSTLVQSSVPARDRSRALTDYPADGLRNPPQVLEADVRFQHDRLPPVVATTGGPPPVTGPVLGPGAAMPTPRSAFTALVTTPHLSLGMVCLALAVAVGLGALHALEPGHGKTVVAAYLVGTRGTLRQALSLGLIVTATHTAGVYLLGIVTLALSQYIVPERLYPWLGVLAGALMTGLGCGLFFRRYAGAPEAHPHAHSHAHGHAHSHVR